MSFGKTKKCKYCKERFEYMNSFQPFCFKDECILQHNQKTKEKKSKELKKEFRENDKGTLLKIAQMTFNKYIRARDSKVTNKCISCNYTWGGLNHQRQAHASHFISTSKSRLLRFNEDNVHLSCQICNTHLSGNLAEYRIRLIEKIGLEKVEELERLANSNEPCRYSAEDYKKIIDTYRQKIKDLERVY